MVTTDLVDVSLDAIVRVEFPVSFFFGKPKSEEGPRAFRSPTALFLVSYLLLESTTRAFYLASNICDHQPSLASVL